MCIPRAVGHVLLLLRSHGIPVGDATRRRGRRPTHTRHLRGFGARRCSSCPKNGRIVYESGQRDRTPCSRKDRDQRGGREGPCDHGGRDLGRRHVAVDTSPRVRQLRAHTQLETGCDVGRRVCGRVVVVVCEQLHPPPVHGKTRQVLPVVSAGNHPGIPGPFPSIHRADDESSSRVQLGIPPKQRARRRDTTCIYWGTISWRILCRRGLENGSTADENGQDKGQERQGGLSHTRDARLYFVRSWSSSLLFSNSCSGNLGLELFDIFNELLAGVLEDQVAVGEPGRVSEAHQLHQLRELLRPNASAFAFTYQWDGIHRADHCTGEPDEHEGGAGNDGHLAFVLNSLPLGDIERTLVSRNESRRGSIVVASNLDSNSPSRTAS
eukprot:scaffold544_cov320-Pavlova_lutheri.AAC.86